MKLQRRTVRLSLYWPQLEGSILQVGRRLLPTPGNVIFTLLVVGLLLWAQSAGAVPLGISSAAGNATTGTIAYDMTFRFYAAATGGAPLWEEQWTGSNAVQVSDVLFNVMLGSLTPIPVSLVTGHSSLFLGIAVGADPEMTPRVQLGSVPFAVQALTVPDGSVTTAKIADGAVTQGIQGGSAASAIRGSNTAFAWRLSAIRKGYAGVRLEKVR